MTDTTNEPVGPQPGTTTPGEAGVATTEPITAAEQAPARSDHVSISKKWLVIGGGALLAVVLLGGTFAAGAAVGNKAGRFDGRGVVEQGRIQDGTGMRPGAPRQLGDGDGSRGSGHQRGPGGRQGWDGSGAELDDSQDPSGTQQ